MKILRSVIRSGFNVGTAGYFTVLRPNQWFPAARLPDGFHHRSKGAEVLDRTNPDQADSRAAFLSQTMKLSTHDHRLMRPALIVLAAIAITYALLWWISHP